jgi:hypothetical protein
MLYDLHLDLYVADDQTIEPATQLVVQLDAKDGPNSEVVVAARLLVVGAMASNELWVGDAYDAVRCRVVADGETVGVVEMESYAGTRVNTDSCTWVDQAAGWELDELPFLGEA